MPVVVLTGTKKSAEFLGNPLAALLASVLRVSDCPALLIVKSGNRRSGIRRGTSLEIPFFQICWYLEPGLNSDEKDKELDVEGRFVPCDAPGFNCCLVVCAAS